MIDADTIAFHQWLSSIPMMDDLERGAAEKAWQAATARERERAANEAWRAAQWVHNTPDDIAAAIRGYQGIDGGNTDDR